MTLTNDDLQAIQRMLTTVEDRVSYLTDRITERFNTVDENFDALFKSNETREQEYMAITMQLSRLENRVGQLEKEDN